MNEDLPVAVIGAGPVGLAAAAQLVARALTPLVLERGASAGSAMLDWAHVRLFSPWRYNVDEAARALLVGAGWTSPDPERLPTGGELAGFYLGPLAAHAAIAPHIHFGARVTAIGRLGLDKLGDAGRADRPFVLLDGQRRRQPSQSGTCRNRRLRHMAFAQSDRHRWLPRAG
jgi:cation diffusion facilitator CzcD-associated flavoprotein CzcO